MNRIKSFDISKSKEMEIAAVKELKKVLKKYPFIPLESVEDSIKCLAFSYSSCLDSDINKFSQLLRQTNKEWIALGKLNPRKVSYITFGMKGNEKNVKLESELVISQLFRTLENIIKSYSDGVHTNSMERAVADVHNFSKDAYKFINENFPEKFKSEAKKYECIASLVNCFTQLHPKGVAYDIKSIQYLVKRK